MDSPRSSDLELNKLLRCWSDVEVVADFGMSAFFGGGIKDDVDLL